MPDRWLYLNEIRDIIASLLFEVCHAVSIGPHLQPLPGEALSHRSTITQDNVRLDVAAHDFEEEGLKRHWGGLTPAPNQTNFPVIHLEMAWTGEEVPVLAEGVRIRTCDIFTPLVLPLQVEWLEQPQLSTKGWAGCPITARSWDGFVV